MIRSLLSALLVLCLAMNARAEPLDPRGQAKVLKDEGAQAFERGDDATALERFIAAYRIFPSPNLKFNMGFALGRLGRPIEAIESFELFLASAIDAPPAALERARGEVARLDHEIGRVLVVTQPGADVRLDDADVGKTPLRAALRVKPGAHTLLVTKADHQPYRTQLDLAPGMVWASEVALVPRERRRISKVAPIVVGAVALAAAAVGAGLRIHTQLEFDHLQGSCSPDCPRSSWDGLPAQQNAGHALLGIAGAALLVDVGLWVAYGVKR